MARLDTSLKYASASLLSCVPFYKIGVFYLFLFFPSQVVTSLEVRGDLNRVKVIEKNVDGQDLDCSGNLWETDVWSNNIL